jgi:5-methylcytosine-specific restriction endonuclease McrA
MNAHEWTSRIRDLVRREHGALVDLLLALAEFDRLEMYGKLGFGSLFDFLHREVGLSRGSAYYRQVGARLVHRFPEVVEPIRDGRLCITSIIELSKVMTEENRADVLPRFFHRSRQEARQVVVELRPVENAPTRTVVTQVKAVQPVELDPTHPTVMRPKDGPAVDGPTDRHALASPDRAQTRVERTLVEPLSRATTRLHITVSPEFVALLKRAKAGEVHVRPNATDEEVLRAGLDLLLRQQEKRRASVPPRVKRAVKERDGGKCQWRTHDGGICGATAMVQVDHIVPKGKGGPSTVDNCRVLCRRHNLEAARQAYGNAWMDRYARPGDRHGRGSAEVNPTAREPCAAYFVAGAEGARAASARLPIRASRRTTATVATSPPHCSARLAGPGAGRASIPSRLPNVAPVQAHARVMGAMPTKEAAAKAVARTRLAEST